MNPVNCHNDNNNNNNNDNSNNDNDNNCHNNMGGTSQERHDLTNDDPNPR